MPVKLSPFSTYAGPHSLKVPPLVLPTTVVVLKTAPNPVAVPSQINWLRTLPAGPGLLMSEVKLERKFSYLFTRCRTHVLPEGDELSLLRRRGSGATLVPRLGQGHRFARETFNL
jgi:hypothetical protein